MVKIINIYIIYNLFLNKLDHVNVYMYVCTRKYDRLLIFRS